MLSAVEKKSDQVYRWLLAYIDENKFSGNQRLPSENALCRKLGVDVYKRQGLGLAEIFEKIIGNVQFLAEEPITETGGQFIRNVNAVGIVFCPAD